ncbi:MAG TPA: GAF domain-containing protein [Thermoflexia bacterium]|nr:GAF domain-containing protein [Thermoflexia bacterium]
MTRLSTWRASVLNTLLVVTSIAAGPMIVLVVLQAIRNPAQWPAVLIFLAIYLFIIGLAILRRLDFRLRAWGLLLLIYAAGALAFARGGLAGDGRIYLLALPLLTLILIGLRASLGMAIISLLTFAAFALTAHLGWMEEWLVRQDNSLLLMDWLIGGIAFLLTLAVLMAMQYRFSQFQVTIATENRRLYEESEKLRTFNENIVQNVEESILIENEAGRFTFANPKTVEIIGYTVEDLIGQHWTAIIAPEYMTEVEKETDKRSHGIASRYETVLLAQDGQRVPAIVSAHPLFDGDRFTGVLSVLTDITERKRAEEELREYRDHLEKLVEQRSAELVRANEQLEQEITEHEQAEKALRRRNRELALLNRASHALSSTLDLDQVLTTVLEEARRLLGVVACSIWLTDRETGELVCLQSIGPKSDIVRGWRLSPGEGLAGWVAHTGESLIVPNAQVNGRYFAGVDQETELGLRSIISVPLRVKNDVIGVLQATDTEPDRFTTADLTLLEPLAASAAIAIDNAGLVETLRQRTIELQARNEELDAFAHTVAHDLKNQLARIVGFAETLKLIHPELSGEELDRHLHTIAQSGRKMSSIISELLLLAVVRKLEEVDVKPLDMAGIVAEALQRLEHTIEEHQADIILPETWSSASGYGPWIEEVWVNYLSNALSYGGKPENGIPPHIELGFDEWANERIANGATSNSFVRFWVRDNGPGLTPEEQARLFTPLPQFGQMRVKGHGLGLSIVRRVVERLGGQVGVESEVGQGSLFFFTLPGVEPAR